MKTNRKISTLIVSLLLTFGVLSHSAGDAVAESTPVAALESGFWVCDYLATTRGVHAAPVTECSAILEDLKNSRFGGDFDELLGWWRENKIVEHQKLDAAYQRLEPAALR